MPRSAVFFRNNKMHMFHRHTTTLKVFPVLNLFQRAMLDSSGQNELASIIYTIYIHEKVIK